MRNEESAGRKRKAVKGEKVVKKAGRAAKAPAAAKVKSKAVKAKAVKETVKDLSTEEKIKEAAKKLFTLKGFAAVKTRDIAREAGINLSLLNYYFRGKQKLFDIVMMENFRQFIHGISVEIYDENSSLNQKIERITTAYIDFLTLNPDLPLFILNELRGNSDSLSSKIHDQVGPLRAYFFEQLRQRSETGNKHNIGPFHFIANLVGLTVFPFVGKPILQRITGADEETFHAFMQERKKLIPIWLKAILES